MTPRTEAQFLEIRENKKALIMETALELFAEVGYHSTTISSIASKAGISKGLMYNYFESKEELIQQIMLKGINDIHVLFDPDHNGTLTTEEIRHFIDELFRLMERDSYFWKIYFMVMLQPPVFKLIQEDINKMVGSVLQIIQNYFEKRGVEDPDTEARILGALFDGLAFQFILSPENFPVKKIKEKLFQMYC